MSDRSPKPPEALMRVIAHDLRPVKPSPRPLRLALQAAPFALLVSSLILLAAGVRGDSGILGPLVTWAASGAQFTLAIALVWIAAHESTPAGRLTRGTVYSVALTALLIVVAITFSTFSMSPEGSALHVAEVRRVPPWIIDVACFTGSAAAGGILVVLLSWMFRNSLAARPAVAGALYGAGAGVAVNAGWRIACPISTLRHALGAHGTAIVVAMLLGAFIGRRLGAHRLHRADESF